MVTRELNYYKILFIDGGGKKLIEKVEKYSKLQEIMEYFIMGR